MGFAELNGSAISDCASETGLMVARPSCFPAAGVRDIELSMISRFSPYVRSSSDGLARNSIVALVCFAI
jgi:3-oxoacyl-ACP reductase-like protein